MIDLSFLTEEEQEAIMKVLQRDAELKRAEEERVRHLPDKIKDDQQLKNMSGQWFYEAKSKRHRDKIHGADIIRESMRKKKPQIIVEPNQNRTARVKKTWVNNVDRDILLPSELLGEEPEDDVSGLSNSRTVILNPDPYTSDKAQENPRKSSMSSTKLRKNPFNGSMLPEDNLSFEIPNEPSENGQTGLHHTSKEDALFHLKENKSTPYVPKERLEEPRPAVLGSADGSPIKPPIPKARKLTYKNTSDQQPEDNQSHSKMVQRTDSLKSRSAPRGILKRNSSSSSTDSETVRFNHTLEPKSKNLPSKLIIHEGNSEDESIENESSQNPLEPLKHVRFSAVKEEVSQGPELNQGKEVGEFGLLEADISRNGMENSGDFQEFPNKPVFSKFRKPTQQNPAPDSYQSNGFSPSTANTYDQKTHPHSETLTQRLSSSENLSSNKESPKAPSKQLSLESELCANPADECPHWVEPELPQVQDLNNSADHQQGKHIDFKALNAKTSSQYDQRTTEITKATDNSISKVLDWFSRSSNPDAKMPSFLHPQEIQSKGKPGSKWQNNNTMDVENAIPQQNALKSPIFMQGEIKTTENSYPFWGKGDLLSFENGKDSGKDFKKSNGGVLSKQVGKEKEKPSQPLKSQNQGSKRTIPIQDTKNLNEGKETHFLNIDSPLNIFKRLNAECQVASKIEDSSYRNRGNSKTTIDSFENVREPKLKYNMEAESRKVKKDDHLSFPLEGENTKSPTLVASEEFRNKESNFPNQGGLSSPYKKPEGLHQEEASHLPVSQLQRSKYKRVSDRISFWEGEGQTAKLTDKSSNSAGNKVQVSTLGTWPRKSVDLSVGNLTEDQNEYGQIIAKKVDLNKNDQTSHAPRLYSSFKREEFKPKIMGTSQRYTSMYQPGKIPSFQNESISLPMTGNLQFKTNMTFPASKHDSPRNNKVYSCFENDRSSVAQPNPNFKVWSLKERMNENFPKQVNNPLQFQTLRNFWDMGTHSDSMNSSTLPSSKSSLPLNNQKHKEFDEAELKEESALAEQNLLRQNKALHGEEIGKWDSKLIPQTLSDEATFPSKSPVESIQLTRNVPSKENVNEHLDMLISPKLKEDHISREEVKESVVKTNVSPKKYQDHFNRSLKKLLEETPSLSFPPVHDKGSSGNANEPNFSESRTRLQETDLADFEERAESPQQDPKTSKTNTLDPPEVKYKSHISSSEKALKEQPELPDSSNQVKSETVSTGTRSLSKQRRFFEKVMERSCNNSFYKWEVGIPLGEVEDASNNTVVPPKVKSGDYEISQEKLFQRVPALSPSLYQTADLIKKESLEEAANSSQKMSTFHSTYAAIQDKQEPPQMEISETIEKTILPKTELNDLNIALERLHREAQEDELNSLRKKAVSREGKPEFPEGVAITHNQINSSVCMAGESVAPDEKSSQPIDTSLEEPGEEALIICSENSLDSPYLGTPLTQPGSTSCQDSKELPQEISETVTKTIVQSRAELREFHFRTEKLLKESSKSSFLKQGNDIIKNSQSELIDKSALPHQTAASEIQHSDFLEKIKETIEKSLAPSVVESAFDIGFKKILRELSISLPTGTLEKETIRTEDLPSELGKLSRKMTHLDSGSQRDAKAKKAKKVKGEVLKPESQEFEDKANVSEEGRPQVSESRIHIPEILPVHMSPEIGKNEIRDNFIDNGTSDDAYGTTREENFQITNESLPRKKRHSKMSRIELFLASPYKRGEEERESFSGSDVSDEYVGSNTDSQRSSSRSEDESKAVLKALKRDADRKIPSQSLEDIPSDTSNQGKVDSLPEDLVRSAEDVSTVPSHPDNQFAHPEKLKRMSKSVPAFLQDESDDRETDTASESSYQLGRHKKSPSSLTNLSSSSGMTSLSSVSGSAMSVYSGDFGNLDIKGSVQFAIDYIDSLMEFHVFVAQCKDLAAADVKKQRSDPYVKTYLLPDKGKMGKKKTLVMKKTLNPVYNEILRYKIDKQSLKNQKLNLSVWHRDTFKRNSFLGEVELDLETWDWDNKQNKQLKWYPLNRRTAPVALEAENRGEMKLALQYVPDPVSGKKPATTGEVHIWVKECIDLPHLRGNHLNSFVKCTILPDTSRKSRQKTRAVGKTNNPIFNHTMVYDGFRPEDLKEACVELTVWDHHKLTNQFLGGLRIGFGTGKSYEIEVDWMDSTPAEISLWERMVNSPNTWIEDILPLRMLLIAKLTK
ncbi:synaptotagmin-like protein 2 isoform X2 [Monodelphis domestica]|uniref:synaptotagmin-like protein 2 isoform X2 n=1 Tax=Monodelphis domestica TaxID=13616 RepID=UPI0024E2739F|nr:synaptotagmin-like protein 2 isoform X2 [Monodelphis domestica]